MSEHNEQAAFVEYVLYQYQHRADFLRPLFFAVPNANKRTRWQARTLQQEGMTRGVADLLYLQPRGPYAFLAIEMKAEARRGEKNGGLTDDQQAWQNAAANVGAVAYTCYDCESAIRAFNEYMALPEVAA